MDGAPKQKSHVTRLDFLRNRAPFPFGCYCYSFSGRIIDGQVAGSGSSPSVKCGNKMPQVPADDRADKIRGERQFIERIS